MSSPINAKSVKTGKVKKSKSPKVMSVDIFSIDTTTDDAPTSSGDKPTTSSDAKPTVSGDVFSYGSYGTKTEKVIAFGKTSKEADVDSEDDAPSSEAIAKSGKIVAKVVRAMPTGGTTGAAGSVANAAENVAEGENAAVINGAGAFFVVLTFAAVGAMLA